MQAGGPLFDEINRKVADAIGEAIEAGADPQAAIGAAVILRRTSLSSCSANWRWMPLSRRWRCSAASRCRSWAADMSDLQKAEQALKDTRQEVHNLTVMAMRPDLLPDKIELTKNLEWSARAQVRIRLKHLRWLKSQS